MADYEFSKHARDMLKERNIQEGWVEGLWKDLERRKPESDATIHYIRAIGEFEGRYLRLVVDPNTKPQTIATAFFDRKLRRPS